MSVMQIYREAWKKDEYETRRQRRRDVAVSIAAPSVALWAMAHTLWMYLRLPLDPLLDLVVFLILLGAILSFGIFAYACRILTEKEDEFKFAARVLTRFKDESEEDEKNQPPRNVAMLAFAAWLFPMGLAFTLAEMYDGLWMRIGPLESDGSRGEFSSPWGDALLAFSAFCMLAEEFGLISLYDDVKQKLGDAKKEFKRMLSLRDDAEREVDNIVGLYRGAKRERADLRRDAVRETAGLRYKATRELVQIEELHKKTKGYFTEIKKMRAKMRKGRSLALVTLKWCGVVGGIVLVLYFFCEIHRLEMAIDRERTLATRESFVCCTDLFRQLWRGE